MCNVSQEKTSPPFLTSIHEGSPPEPQTEILPVIHLRIKHVHRTNTTLLCTLRIAGGHDALRTCYRAML